MLENQGIVFRFPTDQSVQIGSGAQLVSYAMRIVSDLHVDKAAGTRSTQLVPRLVISGAKPPLSFYPSRRAQGQICLYLQA